MNSRLMDYVTPFQTENKNYLLHVTFWSFSDFNRLPSIRFRGIDSNHLAAALVSMLSNMEEILFEHNFIHFLGYSNPNILTEFLDLNNSKIVTVQFNVLFRSPDIGIAPHVINVDIFVCNKELDFMTVYQNSSSHNGSSKTFHLL